MKRKHLHAVILVTSFLLAGIQPALATKYIPTDTDIGDWDSVNRIYTLTQDVEETIEIAENDLTLDGLDPDGETIHTVTGAGSGVGVKLSGRTGVTIQNLTVTGFYDGIRLDGSNNNELTNNTTSNNERGILLWGENSYSNTLTGNSASNNSYGIWLDGPCGNILTGNTASNNKNDGIYLHMSSSNTLTANTASNNGINVIYGYGIYLNCSSGNVLSRNTVESNNSRGIYLKDASNDNTIYNNNFMYNKTQAKVSTEVPLSTGNVFNLAATLGGGNYWSNWTGPDDVEPFGFVDSPYVFTGGQDNLPWTAPLNRPPVADAGEDQIVYAWIDCFAEVTLDGSGSNDPDGDELTYLWSWTEDDLNPIIDLPVGKHTIELIVNDGEEDSEPDEVVIDVIGPMKGDLCVFPPFISRYGPLKKILAALCLPCAIPEDQIDTDQPILLYPGGIKPTCTEVKKFTWRDKQYTCVFATFDKPELMDATPDNGRVQLQLVGQIKTGQYFYGTDTVRIISWYWKRW